MAESPSQNSSILEEALLLDEVTSFADQLWAWVLENIWTIEVGIQLGLIVGALVPAAVFGPRLMALVNKHVATRIKSALARRLVRGLATLATPVALYITLTVIRVVLGSSGMQTNWVAGAIALMSAWIVVRLVTLVIQSEFWSRVAFFVAWPIAALDAFGALEPVVEQMRALAIPLGENDDGEPVDISLLDVVRTLFYFIVLFWAASFIGKLVASQLEQIDDLSPSLRALIVKVLNVLLPIVALLFAFQIVGFNLATLAVFSGAVGLGVGLGLQRIVSNFVAGFTLIADKSIKPRDTIEIDGTFGWVTSMQARYVALRTRDGTEMLIPNDRFITEGVTNWSRSDRVVRLHAPFGVSYSTDDLRAVQKIATDAAVAVDRVVSSPAPVCNLVGFGDSSVDFDLRFWITDPANGLANVRNEVYLGIWDGLKAANIEIPFPQRDLHVKSLPEGKPPYGQSWIGPSTEVPRSGPDN